MAERVFYEVARWRLDEQLAQMRELNSRLAGIFTAATALLVLFAAFQGFQSDDASPTVIGLLAAGGVGYVLLVVVVFVGYLDRRMNLAPDLRQLLELSQSTSEEDQRRMGRDRGGWKQSQGTSRCLPRSAKCRRLRWPSGPRTCCYSLRLLLS